MLHRRTIYFCLVPYYGRLPINLLSGECFFHISLRIFHISLKDLTSFWPSTYFIPGTINIKIYDVRLIICKVSKTVR